MLTNLILGMVLLSHQSGGVEAQLGDAWSKKDWRKFVALVDKMPAAQRNESRTIKAYRFYAESQYDEAAALKYARQIEPSIQNDWMILNNISDAIAGPDSTMHKPDYKLALRFAQKAHAIVRQQRKYVTADRLSAAKFRTGDKKGAIALQRELIAMWKSLGAKQASR